MLEASDSKHSPKGQKLNLHPRALCDVLVLIILLYWYCIILVLYYIVYHIGIVIYCIILVLYWCMLCNRGLVITAMALLWFQEHLFHIATLHARDQNVLHKGYFTVCTGD